ncbi:MAG: SLC45 family MFS transporter, partial [Eubacteriaceae bacterium]|nr:SLC45 family MFS transporter [Eubacteriaceae bacterium]
SISAFWQIYDSLIPLMLQTSFHLKDTIIGGIMALDNVLAIFMLPLFGTFSDKTNTKIGKRMPYIIAGTIAAVIFMLIIPTAAYKDNLILFIIALGIVLISMGTYRSPAVALMPDFTPKYLRSRANAIISLMGTVGGIFALVSIRVLIPNVDDPDYLPVFIAVAAVMVISVIVLVLTIKENKIQRYSDDTEEESSHTSAAMPKEVRKSLFFMLLAVFFCFMSFNAIMSAFSRYAVKVWGLTGGTFANSLLVFTIFAIAAYMPAGIIAGTLGRKNTVIIGLILLSAVYFFAFLITTFSAAIYVVFAFAGIGFAAITVNAYPMVVDMSKSSDVGKYTGYYYTFSMAAQIVTPILSGFFLEHISYRTLFPYAMFFSVLSIITIMFVKHGDSKPEKSVSLESFAADD